MLIEKFLWRRRIPDKTVKTIVKPSCIKKYINPHVPVYKFGYCTFDCDGNPVKFFNEINKCTVLRINHYFTKSKEQWIKRRALGTADGRYHRTIEEFYFHEKTDNDIFDDTAIMYVNDVKEMI